MEPICNISISEDFSLKIKKSNNFRIDYSHKYSHLRLILYFIVNRDNLLKDNFCIISKYKHKDLVEDFNKKSEANYKINEIKHPENVENLDNYKLVLFLDNESLEIFLKNENHDNNNLKEMLEYNYINESNKSLIICNDGEDKYDKLYHNIFKLKRKESSKKEKGITVVKNIKAINQEEQEDVSVQFEKDVNTGEGENH